jgi:hypothetical protein
MNKVVFWGEFDEYEDIAYEWKLLQKLINFPIIVHIFVIFLCVLDLPVCVNKNTKCVYLLVFFISYTVE